MLAQRAVNEMTDLCGMRCLLDVFAGDILKKRKQIDFLLMELWAEGFKVVPLGPDDDK